MYIVVIFVLLIFFIFIKASQLPSFIPVILCIFPLQQCILISYTYFFKEGFFAEYFIHNSILNDSGLIYIIFNYLIYTASVYFISFLILKKIKTRKSVITNLKVWDINFPIERLVNVYLVTTVLFLIATALDGFFPKLVRIIYSTISFTPIVVGFFITKLDRKVVYSFFLIVIVFLGINLLAGSRGYIAIVGITFTLGFLANKENNKFRLVFFITSTVVAIVIFPLLSFLEDFRQINDRIGFDEVDKDRLATLVDAYRSQSAEINNDDGLARLITWPNLSVILLTDVSVKAVGLSNLDNDIKFIFTNTFFTGKSVEEAREQHIENLWGTAPTNLYDYNVTLTNSVEFSLMADGIWRYGKYGFIYNLIIIISITLLIESFVLKSIVNQSFTTFKLFILCYMYLLNYNLINVEPLFSVLRSILYNLVFSFIFTTMINLYIYRKNERVNTLDHGPM